MKYNYKYNKYLNNIILYYIIYYYIIILYSKVLMIPTYTFLFIYNFKFYLL